MSDLKNLFKVIAEGKKDFQDKDPIAKVVKNTKQDLSSLFEELASLKGQLDVIESEQKKINKPKEEKALKLLEDIVKPKEEIKEEVVQEEVVKEEIITEELPEIKTPEEKQQDIMADVAKYLTGKSFQQPNPDPVAPNIDEIKRKIRFLEQAIGRIAATGPGGGEVNLRYLDDVDRDTIDDGKYLKYNATTKKFEFDQLATGEVVQNTTLVTAATYIVVESDWYIGVNYNGQVTITLPVSPNSGRVLVIKDESGSASANPIIVNGTIDNDAGGFILQIDNGGVQMVYRNGWRII